LKPTDASDDTSTVAQKQLLELLLLLVDGGSRGNGLGLGSKLKPMLVEKLHKKTDRLDREGQPSVPQVHSESNV